MRPTKIASSVLIMLIFSTLFCLGMAHAQSVPPPIYYGPYNGVFRPGGNGLSKPVEPGDTVLQATSPWSLYCWFRSQELQGQGVQSGASGPLSTLLAGVGSPREEYSRYFGLRDGKLIFWMGEDNSLAATAPLPAAEWHFVAATFDGVRVYLYSDGQEVASGKPALGRVSPNVEMAPEDLPWKGASTSVAGSPR